MEETLGYFLYQNIHTTQQVKNIKNYFTFLLQEENFDIIIELGTSLGGLTYILDDIIKENNLKHNIHTFDFSYKDYVENFLLERNCNYYILDEREDEFKNKVIELIQNNGKTLLLCDGGNKIQEFNLYSEFLKSGDIIMAHDYCKNSDVFENQIKNKIWDWWEIRLTDIEESIKLNKLSEYSNLDFTNAVWACYQKN